MRPVDVRLGGEVDDRVGLGDERPDDLGIGDVTADEPAADRPASGSARDRVEVRLVAGVGQLVEDRDHRPVAPGQDVADVAASR